MKRTFFGLAAAMALFVTELQTARPSDACGLRLIVKAPSPRQAVARSSRPSDILLLGAPSHHLQRDLSARGHKVEVAPSPAVAKHDKYAAVMTDASHFDEAKTKYGAGVVFLYKDFTTDAQTIESAVVHPTNAMARRVVVTAKQNGKLVAFGGGPTPPSITQNVRPPDPTKLPKTIPPSKLDGEMFFGVGSVNIGRQMAIASAVAWLHADESRTIVISGFADPTGSADANMALSQSRADAVKDAIVSQGIDGSRIEVKAYGASQLKYGRSDARNRRVWIQGR